MPSLIEIFFAAYCNPDGGTHIPNCSGCNHNIMREGCQHPQNPMNIALKEVANV